MNVSLTNSCIYLEGSYNRGFSSFGNTTKVKILLYWIILIFFLRYIRRMVLIVEE